MSSIPVSIDAVTPDWLADVSGLAVADIEPELIGVGVGVSSSVYRLRLTGQDVPDTLILKLRALDEAAVFTSSMLRMYEREVKFFDQLAHRSPILVPNGYGGAVSDDGTSYYLLMEDIGQNRAVDQNEGMSTVDAERAVDALAAWHAEFWGNADEFVTSGAAMSLNDEIYHGVLPVVFGEGWAKIQAEMEVLPTVADVAPRWTEKLPDMLAALAKGPTTLLHGDYRADNIFFTDDDEVLLLDFQITGVGTGAYDLAYFVTQSLPTEVAGEQEAALFERYRNGLIAGGVPESDTARLWEDYRIAALFCLVYPVVASRGMDLTDPRQYQLVAGMSAGCARAVDALGLRDLL